MKEFRLRRFRPVQLLLYFLLRFVGTVVTMFPWSAAPAIARVLAAIGRRIDRRHRRIAEENLERAGFDPGLVRDVYEHFALTTIEMIMAGRLMEHHPISRYVRIEGAGEVQAALKLGRGVIGVIGHLGNWELAGIAAMKAGYPIHSLARPIENPYINEWLLRTRTSTGQAIISKYGALQPMVEVLKRNEILIIQVDQDARRGGIFVDFFGRPASTHRSPALLSLKYGAPILCVNIYRENGTHHFVVGGTLHPADFRGRPDAVKALTQAFTTRLEEFVRQHPEQWNWLHRRWKTADRVKVAVEAGVLG